MSKYKIKYNSEDTVVYQYYGKAKDMPRKMKQYFEDRGFVFEENEWVNVNEYVEFSLENRWFGNNEPEKGNKNEFNR